MKKFFQNILDKIEQLAFKVPSDIGSNQNMGDLSTLNTLISHPNLFYRYLKSEINSSLSYNLMYCVVLFWYLPYYFAYCLGIDHFLTVWLLFASMLNILVVLPKSLILKKLNCFAHTEDRVNLSRSLWLLIRCKVYTLATKITQLTFFVYLAGVFRFWQLQIKTEKYNEIENFQDAIPDNHFMGVCLTVIVGFILKLLLSFLKFNFIFHPSILDKNAGLLKSDLNLLKIAEFNNEIKEKYKDKNECAICYEDFQVKEKIRVMSCPGKHLFHVECIDKWLLAKKTCPSCNFNLEIFINKAGLF